MCLIREVCPRAMVKADFGRPEKSDNSSMSARLALPSAGADVTRTTSMPLAQPTTSLRDARGVTLTVKSAGKSPDLPGPRVEFNQKESASDALTMAEVSVNRGLKSIMNEAQFLKTPAVHDSMG